ncbi:MAG: hypothetical protein IT215_08745 [Chitinophagaceae bacterium]|nr:hypothetical protein [Chitinophagaceae bacterium]HMN32820.1 YtxH domain-containing protein [Chitinophagaceae bacterium]
MQELINKIMSEVGLTSEQAQKTVNTVVQFVKSKVPPALSGNIDAMFSGVNMDSIKEKLENKSEILQDKAESIKDKLEDFAEDAKDKIEDFAEDAKDKIEDLAKDAMGKIKGFFGGENK